MSRKKKRSGFTLAEITVVMGIAGLIMAITAAGGIYAKKASDRRAAIASVATLELAVTQFEAKRGRMPADLDGDGITKTAEIIDQLKGWALLGDDFSDLDPWGKPYVIVLKRDYTVSIDTMHDLNLYPLNDVRGGFQIYSYGPDGDTAFVNTADAAIDDISNFGSLTL